MKKVLFLAVMIVIVAAFFASSNPDGLEKVAGDLGFINQGVERASVMTDYEIPSVQQAGVSTSLAGIIGLLLCFGVFWGTARLIRN